MDLFGTLKFQHLKGTLKGPDRKDMLKNTAENDVLLYMFMWQGWLGQVNFFKSSKTFSRNQDVFPVRALNMVIIHCYISLLEGTPLKINMEYNHGGLEDDVPF